MVRLTKLGSSKVYKDTKYVVLKEKTSFDKLASQNKTDFDKLKQVQWEHQDGHKATAHCVKGDVKERVEKPNRKITFSSSTISCEDREKGDRLFLEMHNEKTTGNRQAPPGKSQLYIRKK